MRAFIDRLRSRLGVAYPLAHSTPFVGPGRRLLLEEQQASGLPGDFWLVAIADAHEPFAVDTVADAGRYRILLFVLFSFAMDHPMGPVQSPKTALLFLLLRF